MTDYQTWAYYGKGRSLDSESVYAGDSCFAAIRAALHTATQEAGEYEVTSDGCLMFMVVSKPSNKVVWSGMVLDAHDYQDNPIPYENVPW